jgi:hypothetical protein
MADTVSYFAYGSNMDPERFRARVGEWQARGRARLEGYRLRFADSVRSEGGGGAVVDPCDGDGVDGVVFRITLQQLQAMDREEFDGSRDPSRLGRRLRRTVVTDEGAVEAELYTVEDDGGWCAPSERYLGHIVRGLEAAGHDREAVERVRRIAALAGGQPDHGLGQ